MMWQACQKPEHCQVCIADSEHTNVLPHQRRVGAGPHQWERYTLAYWLPDPELDHSSNLVDLKGDTTGHL